MCTYHFSNMHFLSHISWKIIHGCVREKNENSNTKTPHQKSEWFILVKFVLFLLVFEKSGSSNCHVIMVLNVYIPLLRMFVLLFGVCELYMNVAGGNREEIISRKKFPVCLNKCSPHCISVSWLFFFAIIFCTLFLSSLKHHWQWDRSY